jgi:hypothetical protein
MVVTQQYYSFVAEKEYTFVVFLLMVGVVAESCDPDEVTATWPERYSRRLVSEIALTESYQSDYYVENGRFVLLFRAVLVHLLTSIDYSIATVYAGS